MKKIYSLLMGSAFLLAGNACDDGSLGHDEVYIPDPAPENFEDDGIAAEPTTTAVIDMKVGEENRHQEIDGFGCAFAGWSHRIWNTLQRDDVMADLFSEDGLNLNIYRGEVFPSYCPPGTEDYDFGMDRNYMLAPDDPKYMNNYWVYYNGEECGEQEQLGQMWMVDHISKRWKDVEFYFSVWCPPTTWKSNGKLNGGTIKDDAYTKFATYLVDFVDAYEQKFGIKVYGMSGWNEPDKLSSMGGWASCIWEPKQMAPFVINNLRPELDKRGHKDVKIIYGENAWWSWATTHVNTSLKEYPELANKNIITAGHGYSTKDEAIAPFEEAQKHNIHIWQTEVSDDKGRTENWTDAMRWAKTFHCYLANGNCNGFVWWAGARPCSTTGENLIQLEEHLPSRTYYRVPRYYTYGQFTKFIDRGAYRTDVETVSGEAEEDRIPDGVYTSAYIKDDTYTIVLVNTNKEKSFSAQVKIDGVEFQNMRTYTSTQYVQWQKKKINPSASGKRAVTVPKWSVVTITGNIKK